MSLRSDSLLAVTGLFPKAITPDEHAAAESVAPTFQRRMRAWVKAAEPKPFDYQPPKKDLEGLFAALATTPDQLTVQAWLEGLGVSDIELVADYWKGLQTARQLVVDAWPKFTIEASGTQILPLSADDAAEVWSLIQVLDDPERVLDELDSFTLTETQARVFREAYPDLYAAADAEAKATIMEQRARKPSWGLTWDREGVLNTFRGKPPEQPLAKPAPPPPPPDRPAKLNTDRDRTQAEVSGAAKGGG